MRRGGGRRSERRLEVGAARRAEHADAQRPLEIASNACTLGADVPMPVTLALIDVFGRTFASIADATGELGACDLLHLFHEEEWLHDLLK